MSGRMQYCVEGKAAKDLENVANELDTTPKALLEGLVDQFVVRHKASRGNGDERRAFARLQLSLPAILYVEGADGGEVRYQPATIRDISPSGLGLLCGSGKLCGDPTEGCRTGFGFEIIFSLSDEKPPIRFSCRAHRVELVGDELHLGAEIETADPQSTDLYQRVYEQRLFS